MWYNPLLVKLKINDTMNQKSGKPKFIPGMELAEGFYKEAVKPVLDKDFPGLAYSAALIGGGSEVLGYDTETSTDHHWGPRAMLFLSPDDYVKLKSRIQKIMAVKLPARYRGYSTNFSAPDPNDNGVQLMRPAGPGNINHRVEVFTIQGYFRDYLGIDITKELDTIDWLTLPQQKLRSIKTGKICHDGLGLKEIQRKLAWYPRDAWLFILAALWQRVGQEEHLTGRAGEAGDEAGSAIIAGRIARDIMRLVLIMNKEYPPYAKWLGTAFVKIEAGKELQPILEKIVHGQSWQERDKLLARAYELLAEIHNNLKITEPLPAQAYRFFGRPFQIIGGAKFVNALLEKIKDPKITATLKRSPVGSIDILTDNSDLLEDPAFRAGLRKFYETPQLPL